MQVSKASEAVGMEITDVDLRSISDSEFNDIKDLFFERGALIFRDQEMTPEEHIAFAERWGEIDINRFFAKVDGYPMIARVLKEADQEINIGGGWHTDHSYDQVPAMGSILRAIDLPPAGGNTKFASVEAAYDALSDEMKERIAPLKAKHSSKHIFGDQSEYAKEMGDRFGNAENAVQDVIHPIVLKHPVTGRKGIYVNAGFTVGIVGMEDEEAGALLGELYAHIAEGPFHYDLEWKPGTIAMWDNRSTWHWALNDYNGHRRDMHRITVKGVPLHS